MITNTIRDCWELFWNYLKTKLTKERSDTVTLEFPISYASVPSLPQHQQKKKKTKTKTKIWWDCIQSNEVSKQRRRRRRRRKMKEVIIHVYDVTNSASEKTNSTIVQINRIFKDAIGLGGIFHSAIQVSLSLQFLRFSFFICVLSWSCIEDDI